MEYRQEMSAFVKSYALNQFYKQFKVPIKNEKMSSPVVDNVKAVKEFYRPQRYYRRKNAPPEDNESRIQITLLEYGQRGSPMSTIHAANIPQDILEDQYLVFLIFLLKICT